MLRKWQEDIYGAPYPLSDYKHRTQEKLSQVSYPADMLKDHAPEAVSLRSRAFRNVPTSPSPQSHRYLSILIHLAL